MAGSLHPIICDSMRGADLASAVGTLFVKHCFTALNLDLKGNTSRMHSRQLEEVYSSLLYVQYNSSGDASTGRSSTLVPLADFVPVAATQLLLVDTSSRKQFPLHFSK